MSNPREWPRLGGLPMDPLADMALPLLLNLSAAVAVSLVGKALGDWAGLQLLPGLGLAAFLFAWEAYLFTTLFVVREVDVPGALRWVEIALMAFLAKFLSALPLAGWAPGPAAAGLWERWDLYPGIVLLAFAWYQGMETARRVEHLHPGLLESAPGQERLANNDHVKAFASIRAAAFGTVAFLAAVLGALAWLRGDLRIWGWNWLGAGLLLQSALGAGAVLVAAQLKQRATWALERIQVSPAVYAGWVTQGLTLLLVPALLALLVPAGPRLPVERLLALLPDEGPVGEIRLPPPPEQPDMGRGLPPELLAQGEGEPRFRLSIPSWVWWTLGAALALWLLYVAAKQLAERSGRLKGVLAVLAVVAAWYLALWKALQESLFGVIKQALATPVEALGAVFSEAGALGRYLPFRGGRAPGDPRAALRYYFARLQMEARRKGMPRPAGSTAAEFGRRLSDAAPAETENVAELVGRYETARYSQQPVDEQAVSFARRAWVAIARAVGRK